MSKRAILAIIALTALLATQTPAATQQPGPRMIVVDVSVMAGDVPVEGLKAEDFVLEDRGKTMPLALFDITDSRKTPAVVALPAGVVANRLNSKGEANSTATVLLYDRINSESGSQAYVRPQILKVLANLKDNDRLGFYSLGLRGLEVVTDFNQDPKLMSKAAQALSSSETVPEAFTPAEKAMFAALKAALAPNQLMSAGAGGTFSATEKSGLAGIAPTVAPSQDMDNQARVNRTFPSVQAIARHMGGAPGRKSLIWISSVFPLTYGNATERRADDQREVDRFKRYLTEQNIFTYPVDPSGAGTAIDQAKGAASAHNEGEGVGQISSIGKTAPTALTTRQSTLDSAISSNSTTSSLSGNQTMLQVADVTGGSAYRNTNDISVPVRAVLSGSKYIYTLGFIPDAKSLDGRDHDLRITLVKSAPKAKLLYHKRYFAWGDDTAPSEGGPLTLDTVVNQGLVFSGIGLMGAAKPNAGKPGTTDVGITVSAGDLSFTQNGDKWESSLELAVVPEGGTAGIAKRYTPSATAEQLKQALEQGLPLNVSIETGPNAGVLHVAVIDKKSGHAGSLVVPYPSAGGAVPRP